MDTVLRALAFEVDRLFRDGWELHRFFGRLVLMPPGFNKPLPMENLGDSPQVFLVIQEVMVADRLTPPHEGWTMDREGEVSVSFATGLLCLCPKKDSMLTLKFSKTSLVILKAGA